MAKKLIAITTKRGHVVRISALNGYATKEGSKEIPPDRYAAQYGNMSLVEPIYNPEALGRLLELNTFHARCVGVKSSDMVGLGYGLTPLVDAPSDEQKARVEMLFKNGIHDISFEDMLLKLANDYWSVGDAYMEVVREDSDPGGLPVLLNHIPAHTMRIHISNKLYVQQRNALFVWFKQYGLEKDVDFETGEQFELYSLPRDQRASEIIPFKLYNARSDYYGLAPIIPALGAVTGMQGLRDYNLNFFETFGVPAYAVYITGDYELGDLIDDDGITEGDEGYDSTTGEYVIVRMVKDHLEAIKNNPQSPLILAIPSATEGAPGVPPGKVEVTFEKLATEVKEASFRMYRKDMKDEILVAHGIPPYRIGIAEVGALGGNFAVESTKIYKSSVVRPGQRVFATPINELILQDGLQVTDWQFYFEEIDTTDEKHDMEIADNLFKKGSMTPNQLIQYFGKRFGISIIEDPSGDLHYMPSGNEPMETQQLSNQAMLSAVKEFMDRLMHISIKDRAKDA
jgi:PBSX family phage portal protein